MSTTDTFFDTNVILYALSTEREKAIRSDELIEAGGIISVQVLNEFALVARRKYRADWATVQRGVRNLCEILTIVPLTLETHQRGIEVSERFKIGIYDSMIVAAALLADCGTLWSEDMHDGLEIEGLTIRNPYKP